MAQNDVNALCDMHEKWLVKHQDGKRAKFNGLVLRNLDLSNRNLSGAEFIGADCRNANFSNSNISGCNFYRAKLDRADLSVSWAEGVLGNGKEISTAQLGGKTVIVFPNFIQFGCVKEDYSIFDKPDEYIITLDDDDKAIVWWATWKETVRSLVNV